MTEFQPWTITGGTLRLNPWPEHSGNMLDGVRHPWESEVEA